MMKEQPIENEITEAMEMLGAGYEPTLEIEAPRTVTERRGGKLVETDKPAFIKIYTNFKDEMKDIDGDALKVWLFIALSVNRFSGEAHPGLRAIADGVGLAVNTVRSAIDRLGLEYNLLHVDKEEGRSNKYYPVDYVSANRGTVSQTDTVAETVSKTEPTVSNSDGTVSNQYRKSAQPEEPEKQERRTAANKKGDYLDGMEFYGKQAKEQGIDKVEEVIQQLERGLHVNIDRSLKNQQVIKRILKDGRPVDRWLAWVTEEEWRAAHTYLYADLEKVWRDFPQAFAHKTDEARPEYKRVADEPVVRVPRPANLPRPNINLRGAQ